MPPISGSSIAGMAARLRVVMRVVDLGRELFFMRTFGFLSFIFGRSTALGASNSGSLVFTTVKTTSMPASRKRPAWIRMLRTTALEVLFVSLGCLSDLFLITPPILIVRPDIAY